MFIYEFPIESIPRGSTRLGLDLVTLCCCAAAKCKFLDKIQGAHILYIRYICERYIIYSRAVPKHGTTKSNYQMPPRSRTFQSASQAKQVPQVTIYIYIHI